MTVSISDGMTTSNPLLVLGHSVSQEARVVIHRILGKVAPDVSLVEDTLREGTLTLLYKDTTEAEDARAMLAQSSVFTFTDSDVPSANMTFVRQGSLDLAQDDSREFWLLVVGFEEVDS